MKLYDSKKKNKDNKRKFTTLFKKRDALVSKFDTDMIKSK